MRRSIVLSLPPQLVLPVICNRQDAPLTSRSLFTFSGVLKLDQSTTAGGAQEGAAEGGAGVAEGEGPRVEEEPATSKKTMKIIRRWRNRSRNREETTIGKVKK